MDILSQTAALALDRSISWIEKNLTQFELSNACSTEDRLRLIKPIGELALAAGLLKSLHVRKDTAEHLLKFCWLHLDEGDEILRILLARPDLIVASTIFATFKQHGFVNQRLEGYITYLSGTDTCKAIEFPAWRRLDVLHGLSILEIFPFPPNPHVGTWMAMMPEPWMLTDDIAYAMTHAVFYITDFGHSKERLDPTVRTYLARWLPLWMKIYFERKNLDIVAELLIVAACISESRQFDVGVRRFISSQHDNGVFSGPGECNSDSPRGEFLHHYHTTLVGLLACAMRI